MPKKGRKSSKPMNSLDEIAKTEADIKYVSTETDPEKNDKAISIIQGKDGNWKGKIQKNGKLIEVRTNDPQTVLLELLTHQ